MGRKIIDLKGKRFGKLVVIERASDQISTKGHKIPMWLCKCDCGNTKVISGSRLRGGKANSCGCDDKIKRNENGQFIKGQAINDLTGKRFGKLTVVCLDRIEDRRSWWIVKCDCGNVKTIRGDTLKAVCSCGCIKEKQDIVNLGIKNNHQMTYHPVYRIWSAMMNRCYNPNSHAYSDYGGRGIVVCKDWRDIKKFAKWADETGFVAGKNLSIERKDVNGNYCPENCIWINKNLQARNRRNTIKFTINGIEKPLSEWSEIYGIKRELVTARYERGCRNVIDLFFDGNLQMRDVEKIMVYGEKLTKREIANKYGIKLTTINGRVKNGILDEKRLLYKGDLRGLK